MSSTGHASGSPEGDIAVIGLRESGIRKGISRAGSVLDLFLHRASTVLDWCRYRAFLFSAMRVLVFREVQHLDESLLCQLIAQDEASKLQFIQHVIHAAVVVWQDFSSDALGTIFEATGTVGKAPETCEEKTGQRRAIGKGLVLEKSGLDVS